MRSVLFGLLQALGALGAAAGVYLLLGLAWALVIVCGLVFLIATVLEMMTMRVAPPTGRPVRRGPPDALPEPDRVTELPGAARSRPRKEG